MAKKKKMAAAKTGAPTKGAPAAVKRILNCIPSAKTETDWQLEHALAAGVAAPAAIPASTDLRAAWWDVGNQAQTGSCVGWACADSVLRWHFVKANKISKTDHLSPRFQWMAAKETDEFITQPETFIEMAGTSLKASLDIARKYGAVKDALLPFGSGALYGGEPEVFFASAAQLKITSYFNLGRDLSYWRRWLATQGPIMTRLDVDSTWDNATATKGHLTFFNPATTRGGHAVAFVGYDQGVFIVRNSWGTAWGDKGFAYASDAYAGAAFTEAYGVTVS